MYFGFSILDSNISRRTDNKENYFGFWLAILDVFFGDTSLSLFSIHIEKDWVNLSIFIRFLFIFMITNKPKDEAYLEKSLINFYNVFGKQYGVEEKD